MKDQYRLMFVRLNLKPFLNIGYERYKHNVTRLNHSVPLTSNRIGRVMNYNTVLLSAFYKLCRMFIKHRIQYLYGSKEVTLLACCETRPNTLLVMGTASHNALLLLIQFANDFRRYDSSSSRTTSTKISNQFIQFT